MIEKQVGSIKNIHFLPPNPCMNQINHQYECYLLHWILYLYLVFINTHIVMSPGQQQDLNPLQLVTLKNKEKKMEGV